MSDDVLISAEHVSKKFCRSLKRSLLYGAVDIVSGINPFASTPNVDNWQEPSDDELREEEFWALRDINFEVRRGECLGLIGHNGAGKSTLLKLLNGLLRPDRGRIRMRGRIGAMIELGAGFNPVLTGRENIHNQAALLGFSGREVSQRFDEIVQFAEIEEALDMPLQNYSSGMKTRLGFSVYAHLEPDVLLIDEVLSVGDVGFRMKSLNKMGEILNRCAVIFVTHAMPQVFRACSQVLLLKRGMSIFQGRDVPAGVSRYFDEFGQSATTVTGTGLARVLDVQMQTPKKSCGRNEILEIRHEEELRITVDIQLDGYREGLLQFLFWNKELLPVMDLVDHHGNGLRGYHFSTDSEGRVRVSGTIDQMRLNSGRFTMSVIVLATDLTVLCRHDSAAEVLVEANCASGASILYPARWEMTSQ